MCERAVWLGTSFLHLVPDHFKTQEIYDDAVRDESFSLQYVPGWFVTQQQVNLWDDRLISWYNGYQKRKAQKAKIKEELLPITWHPDRVMDWCVPKDQKKIVLDHLIC